MQYILRSHHLNDPHRLFRFSRNLLNNENDFFIFISLLTNQPATFSLSGDTDIYRAAVDTIVAESPTEPGADMAIILCGYKVPSLSHPPCLNHSNLQSSAYSSPQIGC